MYVFAMLSTGFKLGKLHEHRSTGDAGTSNGDDVHQRKGTQKTSVDKLASQHRVHSAWKRHRRRVVRYDIGNTS